MRRNGLFAAVVVMTALLLSACGSSGNSGGSAKKASLTGFFGASASAAYKATPVFHNPQQEYTRALLAAHPRPDLHSRAPVRP